MWRAIQRQNVWTALLLLLFAGISTSYAGESNWIYQQSTGKLFLDGKVIGEGYSGKGKGLNNPKLEDRKNLGPIPRGNWKIGDAFKHESKGPLTIKLTPIEHNAHGRDNFLIHGDNDKGDKSASEGCIILSKALREKVSKSGIKSLTVIE